MLKVAVAELFSDDGDHPDPWQSVALRRWLWYWCAPVWGSYLVILFVVGMVQWGWLCDSGPAIDLRIAAIAWWLYAVAFMRAEATRLNRWGARRTSKIGARTQPTRC